MASSARSKAYFDTTVFVAALIGDTEPYHADSLSTIRFAQAGGIEGVFSGLVVAEVFGCATVRAPQSQPHAVAAERIVAARQFFRGCDFLSVDLTKRVGERASVLAVDFHLKGADASHLAIAEWSGCDIMYTLDHGLLKVGSQVGGLTVTRPQDPMSAPGTLLGHSGT